MSSNNRTYVKRVIVDFAPKPFKSDDNDYEFDSPTMRVWGSLVGNHSVKVASIFPRIEGQNNTELMNEVAKGAGRLWDPETLSFMRSDVLAKRMMNQAVRPLLNVLGPHFPVVDATSNIGGETIQFALMPFVSSVKAYEPNPTSYAMLLRNIDLYNLGDKVTAVNNKFDYNIPAGCLVLLDPPFQAHTNIGNFNMSIESRNIHAVIDDIFKAGAGALLLNTPRDFVFNSRFGVERGYSAVCYRFGNKNVKIYIVTRASDFSKMRVMPAWSTWNIKGTDMTVQGLPQNDADFRKLYSSAKHRIN
jgi:hypothetical protein